MAKQKNLCDEKMQMQYGIIPQSGSCNRLAVCVIEVAMWTRDLCPHKNTVSFVITMRIACPTFSVANRQTARNKQQFYLSACCLSVTATLKHVMLVNGCNNVRKSS